MWRSRCAYGFQIFLFSLALVACQPNTTHSNGSLTDAERANLDQANPTPAAAAPATLSITPRNVYAVYYQADVEPAPTYGPLLPDDAAQRNHLATLAGAAHEPHAGMEVFSVQQDEGGDTSETINALVCLSHDTPFLLHKTGDQTYSRIIFDYIVDYYVHD